MIRRRFLQTTALIAAPFLPRASASPAERRFFVVEYLPLDDGPIDVVAGDRLMIRHTMLDAPLEFDIDRTGTIVGVALEPHTTLVYQARVNAPFNTSSREAHV
jgi:hypothetical protein